MNSDYSLKVLGTPRIDISASKSPIRRFVITEKAPTRAFSWLKPATSATSVDPTVSQHDIGSVIRDRQFG